MFDTVITIIYGAVLVGLIVYQKLHNQDNRDETKRLEIRIAALENHPEITKAAVCSTCTRQVARYFIDRKGHVVCANCDVHGYEKHVKRGT